jgi:hypothetical protein
MYFKRMRSNVPLHALRDLGLEIWGLGFTVQNLGSRTPRAQGLGLRGCGLGRLCVGFRKNKIKKTLTLVGVRVWGDPYPTVTPTAK